MKLCIDMSRLRSISGQAVVKIDAEHGVCNGEEEKELSFLSGLLFMALGRSSIDLLTRPSETDFDGINCR